MILVTKVQDFLSPRWECEAGNWMRSTTQYKARPCGAHCNAIRYTTRPNDVPWWWAQLNPILTYVFICNVPVSQCSITSLDDKLNRSRLMSWCSKCINLQRCGSPKCPQAHQRKLGLQTNFKEQRWWWWRHGNDRPKRHKYEKPKPVKPGTL